MTDMDPIQPSGFFNRVIYFFIANKIITFLLVLFLIVWGLIVAPFNWDIDQLPRDPVAVDAIPDIGENQQIIFTPWSGRSPQDVEDQITYPLTVSLLGVPGVRTIRSFSFFGFSSIYVIFNEDVEFYWTRSRVLEKLNSLPSGTLPEGVRPALGPDATALGQVYWYTLEGRDPEGEPVGGWDLHELRSIQDWYVRFGLMAAEGISEVASIGGFVQEYQVDVDPDAMRAFGVRLEEILNAVKMSNVDVGARTIEVNRVEYVIRGLGLIESLDDIENTVVTVRDNVPVYVRDIANVTLGPAMRRGLLDKAGAEAVGGVAVVRYGTNPLAAIQNLKMKIDDISPGMPIRVVIDETHIARRDVEEIALASDFEAYQDGQPNHDAWLTWLRARDRAEWPDWITTSQVTVVPFYDRTGLINETLGTLNTALLEEILITVIVVLVMVFHLRSAILISGVLPLAVLMCFIAMKQFGVDANIVALSGIAIAIGTMVDMGVIVCENILLKLKEDKGKNSLFATYEATREVGGAVVTAVATTVVSFLPVFAMTAAEGKLFRPLAFTKTFALISSVMVALIIIPALAHLLLGRDSGKGKGRGAVRINTALILSSIVLFFVLPWWAGTAVLLIGIYGLVSPRLPVLVGKGVSHLATLAAILAVGVYLSHHWQPLGAEKSEFLNFSFVALVIGGLLLFFLVFQRLYAPMLRWCLEHKSTYLAVMGILLVAGMSAWLGVNKVFGFVPSAFERVGLDGSTVRQSRLWQASVNQFPGLGKEFMPSLDEGSFLYMPTAMPHASIGEALEVLQFQDRAISGIPEVASVVGKIGRVESPLDPAPIAMVETIINYVSEYKTNDQGRRLRYGYDKTAGEFDRDDEGELIPDKDGRPFRQWRDSIKTTDDIWKAILDAATIPGSTSSPKLQPIATRLIMLQTGMRSPIGVKVKGPDLETIEAVGLEIERLLKEVPSIDVSSVFADRIVGKPYLEIDIDREAIARYGIHIRQVQDVIEVAVGGRQVTTTVEGRERYAVRVRYLRELRDSIESLDRILVAGSGGVQIPLGQLSEIRYVRGPQAIKSEDTFLVGYVLFDKMLGHAEVDVVEDAQRHLGARLASGDWVLPAGVSYTFAGNYENQIRSQKTLRVVLPLALFIIFIILYLQFRSVATTTLVFSGILVAWAGGFLLIWMYGQPWFMDFTLFDTNMRDLFQIRSVNLSVAIWVGFLALFGIASDNGVLIATYLDRSFKDRKPETVEAVREATVAGAQRRIRPCLMTSATTLLALIPVLSSTGRGADIMVPMAIPSFGGMLVVLVTVFLVPVLYSLIQEWKLSVRAHAPNAD